MIYVTTQEQLDAALKDDPNANIRIDAKARIKIEIDPGARIIELIGSTVAWLTATDRASVMAYGSTSVTAFGDASVTAYDDASVMAYDDASVTAFGDASVTAFGDASVTAFGDASVTAFGDASVTAFGDASVTAYDDASVMAYGSASVTAFGDASVTAYDDASVMAYDDASVMANGSASVTAYDGASVRAQGFVQLTIVGRRTKVSAGANVQVRLNTGATCDGGQQVTIRRRTAPEWCEFYGVVVKNDAATLYKAVDDKFQSARGGDYTPGTIPIAPDWDGGRAECGFGYHFSPTPRHALEFNPSAARFVGCPVALADIVVHPEGQIPQKIKARGCCAPCWECDRDGRPI